MPGEYRYKGSFFKNDKDGFGEEEDFKRMTRYAGDFSGNEKNGYGELLYGLNSSKKKVLKGYWRNGVLVENKGVLVDET